jgi:uncharacterized caspase-like protein
MKYAPTYHESWALIIGINKYRHSAPLEIATADAEAIQNAVIEVLGFPKTNVSMLLDEKATRRRIMEEFLSYESLDPDDRLLFFFAGHGATVEGARGSIGYLVPVDGRVADKSTLIRWDELTRDADIIPAKHLLFIMDACYSGLAIQRTSSAGERRFVTDMLQRRSRQVITAGKADEVVADGGGPAGGNSIFTGHLLEGLRGGAANEAGVITASDLMSYAYQRVSRDPASRQTPHFGHIDGDGEFILLTPDDAQTKAGEGSDFLVKIIAERPEAPVYVDWSASRADFAEKNGYGDPNSPSFGHNDWSTKLGEYKGRDGNDERHSAFRWLALVMEPVSNEPPELDLASLAKSLPKLGSLDPSDQRSFIFPSQAITTAKSLIFFEPAYGRGQPGPDAWQRFLRIEKTGAMEYCDYARVASLMRFKQEDSKPFPLFLYVQIIGTIWTFLNTAQRLLISAGYTAGVRYIVNVIGAKDSVLVDLAQGAGPDGKHWIDPFNPGCHGVGDYYTRLRCRDLNLQFPFKVVVGSLDEKEIKKLIWSCGEQFGLAYNHQSAPRCFNAGTDEFPWRQYTARD